MRTGFMLSGVLLGSLVVSLLAADPPAKPSGPDANAILRQVAGREKGLTRVTQRPCSIDRELALLCAGPRPNQTPAENPHRGHAIHVYVSPGGEAAMKSGKEAYPAGTLILKEKFPSPLEPALRKGSTANAAADRETELFTAMLKRDAGYDPDRGDWEYLVISGDARQVLARGKLDSCINCHVDHKATDYVIRAYLK